LDRPWSVGNAVEVAVASGDLECATGASAQHVLLAAAAPRTLRSRESGRDVEEVGCASYATVCEAEQPHGTGMEHQKGTRGRRIVGSRTASAARDGDQHRAVKRGGGQHYPARRARCLRAYRGTTAGCRVPWPLSGRRLPLQDERARPSRAPSAKRSSSNLA
jgi:hypothetical protein